ncbi:MAG TPA: flagellar hook protein FlgE [Alphaproteobacteria bacterium]
MSIYGAMFSGVSGLNAQAQALGMISDNISNVNTIGYKTAKASFSTLVTGQTVNNYAPGGVRSTPLYDVDRQGLIQGSASSTDLSISGQGFFVVNLSSNPGANNTPFYSRAGAFTPDASGYLRTPTGFYLMGWATDSNGVPTAADPTVMTSLEAVRVNAVSGSARETANIELGLNLPASAAVAATETTQLQIYDTLGVPHDLTFTWTKTAANAWTVTAAVTGTTTIDEGAVGGGAGYSVNIAFNGDGTPATFDGAATPPALALGGLTSGALDQVIALDFGTPGTANGISQFSSAYSTTFLNQDGAQFGNFFGVSVDEDGIVTALYDNGETLNIYKLPVVTFPNPDGLQARTGTVYIETAESGGFVLRDAGTGSAGKIVPSSLEASTTDIANEFTLMIVTQRAYSANAKIITTADEMLNDLINIKR